MKPTYQIKDWDTHFESAESRKLSKTRWVPMPTKHDGKGYRRITQHNEAVAIFCAWNLIVQVASKQPKRGVLADSDGPLDADDLAAKTGFPAPIFAVALEFLSSDSIGWLSREEQRRVRQPARTRQNPPEPARTRQSSSPEGKGIEGNGTEEKGKEDPVANATGETATQQSQQDFDIWKLGVGKLMATGTPESEARSFLGGMRQRHGDDTLSEAITKMLTQNPVDPKAYLVAILQSQSGSRQTKSKVDNSLAAAGRVAAKYEQRG